MKVVKTLISDSELWVVEGTERNVTIVSCLTRTYTKHLRQQISLLFSSQVSLKNLIFVYLVFNVLSALYTYTMCDVGVISY